MARTLLALAVVALPAAARADDLPPGALARLGDYRFYHGPEIKSAVLSPDGRRAAAAAHREEDLRYISEKARAELNRTIILWDATTGVRLRELKTDKEPVWSLAFSPDGRLAAVTHDEITLFDTETGRIVRRVDQEWADRAYFTPGGKELRVTTWPQGSVTAWEVESGKQLRKWALPDGPSEWVKRLDQVVRTELSDDGRYIAWLLGVGQDFDALPPGAHPSFPFTPPPTALVVFSTATGRPLYRREFQGVGLAAFAFTPDGRRFLTGGDKLRVWDTATGRVEKALDCPGAFHIAVAPGGLRAVVAQNSGTRVWDLGSGKAGPKLGGFLEASHQPFSAGGYTVLLTTGTSLRLFDTATGQERVPAAHRRPAVPRFSADGRSLFTTCDEWRCRWDVTGAAPALKDHTPRHAWEFVRTQIFVQPPVLSADERLFLDYFGDTVRVREVATGRVVRDLGARRDASFGLFSPDGTRVLIHQSDGLEDPNVVRLFDVATGKVTAEFPTDDMVWDALVFSPDGRMVAWADHAHAVHLHDATTGRAVRTIAPERRPPEERTGDARLLFSPDGTRLLVETYYHDLLRRPGDEAVWANLPIRILRVADGREVVRFDAAPADSNRAGKLSCAAWSPDGRLLALAEAETGVVRLVEAETGRPRAELNGHRHGVRGLAFAPDGRTLASGGEDNVVYVWTVPVDR